MYDFVSFSVTLQSILETAFSNLFHYKALVLMSCVLVCKKGSNFVNIFCHV